MGTGQEFNFDNRDTGVTSSSGHVHRDERMMPEEYPASYGQSRRSNGPDFVTQGRAEARDFTSHDKSMGKTFLLIALWFLVPIGVCAVFALIAAVGKGITGA